MLEFLREISLKTILLVAAVVWIVLGIAWYFSSGRTPISEHAGLQRQATARTETPGESSVNAEAPVTQDSSVSVEATDTALDPITTPAQSRFFLQVGAFEAEGRALSYVKQLKEQGYLAYLLPPETAPHLFRVCVGPFSSRKEAEDQKALLKNAGIESFVRQQD